MNMLDDLLNRLKLFLIVAFLIGTGVFYYVLKNYHNKESYESIQKHIILLGSIQKYVSKFQKPVIYKLMSEHKLSEDFFDSAIMSSTFIITHINKIFKHALSNNEYRFASDNSTNPLNKANVFESEILKKFNNSNISSYSQRIKRNGEDTKFFALPSRKNTKACLKCYGNANDAPKNMIKLYGDKNGFKEKLGHISSINAIYAVIDADNNMIKFFLVIELLMLIIFLFIYLSVRYLTFL